LNGDLHASESNNSSKNIYIALHTKILQITRSNMHLSKIEIEIEAIQCTFDVF